MLPGVVIVVFLAFINPLSAWVAATSPEHHQPVRFTTVLFRTSLDGLPPSKHDTLNQCRFNAGPTSETASQH